MKKAVLFILLLLLSSTLFTLSAQDTTKPFMSVNAYDSLLRVAKHADSLKKADSVMTAKPAVDSTKRVIIQSFDSMKLKDSVLPAVMHGVVNNKDTTKGISQEVIDSLKVISGGVPAKYGDVNKGSLVEIDSARRNRVRQRNMGYAVLSYGLCLPVGDYVNLGSASTGGNISLDAIFPGSRSHFGWAFKFSYGWNGLNTTQYLHDATEYIYGPGLAYSMNAPSHNYTWYVLMLGPSYSLPMHKFSLDARLLFGLLNGSVPGTAYNVKDTLGNEVAVNQYRADGHAFAFDFGIGLRYRVCPNVTITLSFDYLTSSPSLSVASSGFTSGPSGIAPVAAQVTSTYQAFTMNNLNIGIGYTIGENRKSKQKE